MRRSLRRLRNHNKPLLTKTGKKSKFARIQEWDRAMKAQETRHENAMKKKKRKKKPGRAQKRKAIANVTSLRAAIERLKAENARLKSAKPKRRKCSCKKKSTSTSVAHTHRKPKRASMRKCAPVSKKRSSRRKVSYKSFIPSFLK